MYRLMLLTVAVATTLLAQPPVRRPFAAGEQAGQPAPRFTALKDYLGLTDAQVTALADARKKQVEAAQPIREQLRAKAEALRTEMQKASPDGAAIGSLIVDIKKLREQLRTSHQGVNSDALAVLNPDQQAKLKALDDARKLFPAAAQASAAGLIAAPERPAGMGPGAGFRRDMGRRMGMGMGMGPMGADASRRGPRF